MKLTCIDGPMFDARKVNFEDVISRLAMFKEQETVACKTFNSGKGGNNGKDRQYSHPHAGASR